MSLHQQEIRIVIGINHPAPEIPGTALAAGFADVKFVDNHTGAVGTTNAANGPAKGAGFITQGETTVIIRIAFVEILDFKPDLVGISVVGDFEVFYSVDRYC